MDAAVRIKARRATRSPLPMRAVWGTRTCASCRGGLRNQDSVLQAVDWGLGCQPSLFNAFPSSDGVPIPVCVPWHWFGGTRRNPLRKYSQGSRSVSYTHLRAHETVLDLVCRLLLE